MIRQILIWALSLFSPKKEEIESWPFPVGHEPKLVAKRKPALKKATTRTVKAKVVAKKATTVAKKKTKAKAK
jgi:hypothetical protein